MENNFLRGIDDRSVIPVKQSQIQLVVQQHLADELAESGQLSSDTGNVDAQVLVPSLVVLNRVVKTSELRVSTGRRTNGQDARGEEGEVELLLY